MASRAKPAADRRQDGPVHERANQAYPLDSSIFFFREPSPAPDAGRPANAGTLSSRQDANKIDSYSRRPVGTSRACPDP